jgi:hypothetical protein
LGGWDISTGKRESPSQIAQRDSPSHSIDVIALAYAHSLNRSCLDASNIKERDASEMQATLSLLT